jgi:hypothetical protein
MATRALDYTILDIEDLDLTKCVVGPDHVVLMDELVTLYRREGRRVDLFGVFDGPAEAFHALDTLDAPQRRSGITASYSDAPQRCD